MLDAMRTLAVAYLAAILLIVALADSGELLGTLTYVHSVWWGDKALHFLFATGLGFFVNAIPREPFVKLGALTVQRANLLLFPAVIAEELSQRWIPGRTFDLRDLAANLLGLTLGSALAWRMAQRQRIRPAGDPPESRY